MHPLAEAAVSGSPANAAYSYLALDHLSSTRAVYNQAKTATASLEFYPYGETFAATGAHPDARFTAKPYDPETGLYYFPYRYYSQSASRWISRDPLGMVDGPNVYGYVKNNPVKFIDFEGTYLTKAMCREACRNLYPKKPSLVQQCYAICHRLKGNCCNALWELCRHMHDHEGVKAATKCQILYNELCLGQ
jgi:RHS repeat-associated protein